MNQPKRKIRVGYVLSNKMNKTVVVKIERLTRDPMYGKILRVSKKFKVHDEENKCKVGNKVKIIECRPLSKEKRWRVLEIIKGEEK